MLQFILLLFVSIGSSRRLYIFVHCIYLWIFTNNNMLRCLHICTFVIYIDSRILQVFRGGRRPICRSVGLNIIKVKLKSKEEKKQDSQTFYQLLDEDICKIWIPFPFVVRWKCPEIKKLCSVYKCMNSSRARNEWKTIQKIFTVEKYWVLPWFGASLGLGSMMASRPLLLLWLSLTQSVCSCCTGLCVWICPNWKTYLLLNWEWFCWLL